jgi:hypothetical protein
MNFALQELGRRWLWIFVDALDECDEDEVRDMIGFFEFPERNDSACSTSVRILFASCYYPQITTHAVELRLENEAGDFHDVQQYIKNKFKIKDDTEGIGNEVERRASGIFIWVVLVVGILNKASDGGSTCLDQKLREIPSKLSDLFAEILILDTEDNKSTIFCIKWTLFAQRPLSCEELYFVIHSGLRPKDVGPWDSTKPATEMMDSFILDCSKGLVELTRSQQPTAQFIHESVRDFLKDNGMHHLYETSPQSFLGSGHNSLRQCCAYYISSAKEKLFNHDPLGSGQHHLPRLPFINYALSRIFDHANAAEAHEASQEVFFREFKIKYWLDLTQLFPVDEIVNDRSWWCDVRIQTETWLHDWKPGMLYKIRYPNDSTLL